VLTLGCLKGVLLFLPEFACCLLLFLLFLEMPFCLGASGLELFATFCCFLVVLEDFGVPSLLFAIVLFSIGSVSYKSTSGNGLGRLEQQLSREDRSRSSKTIELTLAGHVAKGALVMKTMRKRGWKSK
jgi:hypothetical protein